MIRITLEKKDSSYCRIMIQGHSGYDVAGKDIVCAGVSMIAITSINAIIRWNEKCLSYKQDEGLIEVAIKKHDKVVDLLLENMVTLLRELKEQYPKYIKIQE